MLHIDKEFAISIAFKAHNWTVRPRSRGRIGHMDWPEALFFVLLLAAGWLGMVTYRRRETPLSRRQVWVRVAVGIYGFAVLAAIAIAGSKF